MSASNGNNEGPKTIAVPAAVAAGTMARQDFGGQSVTRTGETASTALAAQASAAVNARYIMALQRPRDIMVVRDKLLKDCARRAFAKKAIYRKPIGAGVEGPSIRLAEAAARAMGNVLTDIFSVYDDAQRRIIRVCASDLEANLTFTKDVTIEKTMERTKLTDGQTAISVRMNSKGFPTYTVAATDDDILNKENALASKAMRTCLLRLIPGDIIDEALSLCYDTQCQEIDENPDAEKKNMCDSFLKAGVSVEMLAEYLGHPVDKTTTAELATMHRLFLAIQEGEATWLEAMEHKRSGGASTPAQAPGSPTTVTGAQPAQGKKNVNDLAAEAKAKREATGKPPAPAAGKPGQQTLATPMSKTVNPPEERGDDPMLDKPKAPKGMPVVDDPMPAWGGGPGKPRSDDGTGIR